MNIPKKVKVGGLTYKVFFVDKIEDTGLGATQHSDLTIKIKKGKQEAMEATFLHELLHCFSATMSENDVEATANMFYAFIKDNPKVI